MSRLPIRWKLTLAFALALTVVLTAVGVFLHAQLSADVDAAIERDLRTRADQLRELLMRSPISALPTQLPRIWSRTRRSPRSSPRPAGWWPPARYADVRLLTPEQLRDRSHKELFVDRPGDAMLDESLRIFAMPVQARGETFIVVVTDSLDERAQTLASTLAVEIVGLAAALIASCGIGYWVVRACPASGRDAAAAGGSDQRR